MTTGIIYSPRVIRKAKVRYAHRLPRITHYRGRRVARELFVDINVYKEFFSEGRYTKTLSIYLGNFNLKEFNELDPHYIDARIQSIIGDDEYVFIGYWAGKAWVEK